MFELQTEKWIWPMYIFTKEKYLEMRKSLAFAKLSQHLYFELRCFCVGCKTRALWVWFHYNLDKNWEHGQHILFVGKMHRACMYSKRERDRNTIIPVITCWVDCKRMSCWKNPLVVASRFPGNTNGAFLLEPGNNHNHFVCLFVMIDSFKGWKFQRQLEEIEMWFGFSKIGKQQLFQDRNHWKRQ